MVETLAVLLASLVIGIGLADRLAWAPGAAAWGAAGLCLLLVVGARGAIRPALRQLALVAALVPLASAYHLSRAPAPHPDDPMHWAPLRHGVIVGTVSTDPRKSENGLRFELRVEALEGPMAARGSGRVLVRAESGPALLRYGARVRVRGALKLPPRAQNPGEFDYRSYLARNGLFVVMNAREISVLEAPAPSLVGVAIALKNEALALLSRHLPEAQAALLGSLLFGDGASPIDPETAEAFRALGLAHVLAVSGAQILFLWGMLKGGIARFGLPRWAGVPIGCAGLWGYAVMTGLPPSVVRATWMGCALVIGWAVARPWLRYLTLEAVVLGMLLYRPGLLFDAGFQFSAIATFALLHTAPRLLPYFQRLPEAIAQALAMALAAGVWVLPLQLFHFGQFSPYSLGLNALTCFLVEAVTVLGFLALLGGSISELLGHHLLAGASLLLTAFTGLVSWTLPLPFSSLFIRTPPAFWLFGSYACLAWGLRGMKPGKRSFAWRAGILLAPLVAYGAWARVDRPHALEITVLSIGQGDAIVLRTPGQRWYLIDAGPRWPGGDAGKRTLLPYLRRQGCPGLDGVILSHAHDDHAGGLAAIADGLPVAAAWDPSEPSDSPAYQAWLERVLERGIPLIPVRAGMRAELEAGLTLELLGPPEPPHRASRSDLNNNSIVFRLRYRNFTMLFAGDLELEAERRLLERPERLRASLLKVAHHGSRYGSGEEFLRAVSPEAAIISVGAQNTFRHPAPETLARLRPYGRIYRTDEDGAITVRSDGERWSLTAFNE